MATQQVRDLSKQRLFLDIEAVTEGLALKLASVALFDGAATRSSAPPTPAKLAELFERLRYHERLAFASIDVLPPEATLAQVKVFVEKLVADLAAGADVAVVQTQLQNALARIAALETP